LVVHAQIHRPDDDDRDRRGGRGLTQPTQHRVRRRRLVGGEYDAERGFHGRLTVTGRVEEQAQVFLVRPRRHPTSQHVVGDPERGRREQVVPVPVRRERPRLADQPVDHVPVVDPVLAAATQPRHLLHPRLRVPHLHVLGVQAHLDPLADQPARHRVRVLVHANRAPRRHRHRHPTRGLEPAPRQRTQVLHLLGQLHTPVRVPLLEQLAEERLVAPPAREVPAGAEHQLLVECPLEPVVPLLDVAVLVAAPGLDRLPFEAVVREQRLIPPGELRPGRARRDRGRESVGAVNGGHTAEFRQGVLQPLGERLERLGEAHRAGLPVRGGEDEVVDQVVERLAGDGHPQFGQVREVGGTQPTGRVDLGEEHFLRRSVARPPGLDPPLEGAELPVGKPPGVFPLEVLEQGQSLQPRVEGQSLDDAGPDGVERVQVGASGMRHPCLAGEPGEPAVLACGLGIHPGPEGGDRAGRAPRVQSPQLANLLIRDTHAEPSKPWVGQRSHTGDRGFTRREMELSLKGKSGCRSSRGATSFT